MVVGVCRRRMYTDEYVMYMFSFRRTCVGICIDGCIGVFGRHIEEYVCVYIFIEKELMGGNAKNGFP